MCDEEMLTKHRKRREIIFQKKIDFRNNVNDVKYKPH